MTLEHARLALTLTAAHPDAARRRQQVVNMVLGRVRGLGRTRLDAAIQLLESARTLFDHPEFTAHLSECLAERGVLTAEAKPPPWPEAVADLRSAVTLQAQAHGPRLNLCTALRNWSVTLRESGEELPGLERMKESADSARQGLALAPNHRGLATHFEEALADWQRSIHPCAVRLANEKRFVEAEKLLLAGLEEFPKDAQLREDLRMVREVLELTRPRASGATPP